MVIQLIVPALPPQIDGIGDYTAHLSYEMSRIVNAEISILTGISDGATPALPIVGVNIVPLLTSRKRRSVLAIVEHVKATCPDWVVLQYNPFCYGRWGLNHYLPRAIQAISRDVRSTRIAVMVHEAFVPIINWKFAVMASWQRWQFRAIGRAADVLLFSMERYLFAFRDWFPGKPMIHMPVGSNIPETGVSRKLSRARLGIAEETCVLGVFGTAHASRMLDWIREAALALQEKGRSVLVLYSGPDSLYLCESLPGISLNAEGPLTGEEVSSRLAAVDIYLAPFVDGASTRRGSLVVALQHGLATVTTKGPNTDAILLEQDTQAFLLAHVEDRTQFVKYVLRLANDTAERDRIGLRARRLYQERFSWDVIAADFLSALIAANDTRSVSTTLVPQSERAAR